jgi:hypothetical protein
MIAESAAAEPKSSEVVGAQRPIRAQPFHLSLETKVTVSVEPTPSQIESLQRQPGAVIGGARLKLKKYSVAVTCRPDSTIVSGSELR